MKALIHVTSWERVSLWRRLVCAFGRVALLLVVLNVLGTLLLPRVTIFLLARSEAKKLPWVSVVPQPLTDYSVSDAPGTTLSYFGYSFEVPWEADFKAKQSPKNSCTSGTVQVKFSSGQDLVVIAPANQKGLLSEIAEDPSLAGNNFGLALSNLIKGSAYDQYAALLNTSPSTVHAFGPRAEASRSEILLMIKGFAMPSNLETGAFSFRFPKERGFQIGDPRKSGRIQLEVLDLDGRWVEIICAARRNDIRLTQPELNRILETLHTVPVHSLTAGLGAPSLVKPN